MIERDSNLSFRRVTMPAYVYTFKVKGSAPVPFDMLRYDRCWPATEADAGILETISNGHASQIVTLKGLQMPTTHRWNSFGWAIDRTNLADGQDWESRRPI